jgi:hypothetical protein
MQSRWRMHRSSQCGVWFDVRGIVARMDLELVTRLFYFGDSRKRASNRRSAIASAV